MSCFYHILNHFVHESLRLLERIPLYVILTANIVCILTVLNECLLD